ncbi:UNVERIFIED_CONTAM: hypothetical protein HDU68_007329 [Siphonaria sp. JEL0065]|nr:hypothetical protein HDU68_007329 [Siphonaria sp. JEL0065]
MFDQSYFFDNQKPSSNYMLPVAAPVPAPLDMSFFFLSSNIVHEIPHGYHFGGVAVVPSSPADAVAKPLSSNLTANEKLHPLLCPQTFFPTNNNINNNLDSLDIFTCASPDSSTRQSFELDLLSSSSSSDSTNNTPALGHLDSPRFGNLLPHPVPTFSQLPSSTTSASNFSDEYYPAFLPSQPLVVPSQPPSIVAKNISNNTNKPPRSPSETNGNTSDSRKRTRLSNDQREYMLSVFDQNNQPNTKTLKEVAVAIGTSLRHVQYWFQNRRAALRRRVASTQSSSLSDSEDLAF